MMTTDPLTTPDALALLAAIDAGVDSAPLPLADLLEEAGDERAAGLRRCVGHAPANWPWDYQPAWGWAIGGARSLMARSGQVIGHYVRYDTRSAAFLALAAALVAPAKK